MNELDRHEFIRGWLSRASALPWLRNHHEFSWRLLLAIFAYSLLLVLPFRWLDIPGDIYVGAVSQSDLISRVDFTWQDLDRDKLSAEVMASYYPLYSRRSQLAWTESVIGPVEKLLQLAADNGSEEALLEHAGKSGMKLDSAAARTLREYANKELHSIGGISYAILNPVRKALSGVYRRGVIDSARYAEEIKGGRHFIEFFDSGDYGDRDVHLVEIGGEGQNVPVGADAAAPLVKTGIYDELFMIRNAAVRQVLIDLLTARVAVCPTLIYQEQETKRRFDERVEQEHRRRSLVLRNSLLLAKGQKVTADDFARVCAESRAWLAAGGKRAVYGSLAGKLLLVFFTLVFFAALFFFLVPGRRVRRLAGLGAVGALVFYLMCFCLYQGIAVHILPVGVLAGMAAFGCGATVGMLSTVFFVLLAALLNIHQVDALSAFLFSGCFFAWLAPLQRFRMGLARLGLSSAVAAALVVVCWNVSEGQVLNWPPFARAFPLFNPGMVEVRALWAAAGWLLSLLLLLAGMRALRPLFGVTNNIVIQDFQENRLLARLLHEAPSTYFHCSVTAALAEAAARAVGANHVICRIASLYHDIGKLTKPDYFTENEKGVSRHDKLSPYMSSLIIISHVKEGVEAGRQIGLPPEIIDVIAQHHGTTQVGFFLRRAMEEAATSGRKPAVDENRFRYPGPRPQSQEAAIIMLADSVEAASRSLGVASLAQIRVMVRKIAMGKLNDGQLDDSGLNFTDLARIEEALTMVLSSMFHSRVSYDKTRKP